eukprot:TRINITY_DN14677_c0_g1_i1.p1 TRINITY_DN14677_c0_g1~~TRINITY_DN14677_c0_g1_i1.p1  ORF type:complete len:316 (-),score=84.53 TRINITY_DN14677_c0_g1_i1:1043-1990(-)
MSTTDANDRTVIVTNVSSKATEQMLSQFFSFCGKVESITLQTDIQSPSGEQRAIIVFSQASEAATALLLTGATIADRALMISAYTGESIAVHLSAPTGEGAGLYPSFPAAPQDGPTLQQAGAAQPASDSPTSTDRKPSTVIASLLAAGYRLADEAATKAKLFDAEHLNLQAKARGVKQDVETKAAELHIVDKLNSIKVGVESRVQAVDNQLHITQRATAVATAVEKKAIELKEKALENETVRSGYNWLAGIVSAGVAQVNAVARETQDMIRGTSAPTATTATTTATAAPATEATPVVEPQTQTPARETAAESAPL